VAGNGSLGDHCATSTEKIVIPGQGHADELAAQYMVPAPSFIRSQDFIQPMKEIPWTNTKQLL
jgi:hypothetical protein